MKSIFTVIKRLSIVDYLIIFVVLSGIIASLLFFTKSQVTLYVDLTSVPQYGNEDPFPPTFTTTDALQVGDAIYNWSGKKTAEITKIEKSEWGGNRKIILLTVKMNVAYDGRTHQYTFNDTPIVISNNLSLSTEKAIFNGEIINVYRNENNKFRKFIKKNANVSVNIRNIEAWQADSLRTFEAKNSQGDIIAKTTDIQIVPSEIDVETDRGTVHKGYSTIYKDARVTLHLTHVYCSEQTCYFNQIIPLKIGAYFWVQSTTAFIEHARVVSFSIL